MRKTIRNKGHFPSDDAAIKLIFLALRQIEAKWQRPPKEWQAAKSQLAIQFGERLKPPDEGRLAWLDRRNCGRRTYTTKLADIPIARA